MSKKLCIIHNGRFAYELIVDGVKTLFQSSDSAEYFANHYLLSGYEVKISGNGNFNYGKGPKDEIQTNTTS